MAMSATEIRDRDPKQRAVAAAAREWFLLIDGRWRPALAGQTLEVVDPSTAEVIAHAPAGQSADIDLAVLAARRAFEERRWMSLGAQERGRRLTRVAELIEQHAP